MLPPANDEGHEMGVGGPQDCKKEYRKRIPFGCAPSFWDTHWGSPKAGPYDDTPVVFQCIAGGWPGSLLGGCGGRQWQDGKRCSKKPCIDLDHFDWLQGICLRCRIAVRIDCWWISLMKRSGITQRRETRKWQAINERIRQEQTSSNPGLWDTDGPQLWGTCKPHRDSSESHAGGNK